MGIVHHANYFTYFEAGRVDFLHKRGIAYQAWVLEGVHLPVVSASIKYRKAARFDEVLVVRTACAQITRVTVRFTYLITRGADLLAEGETLLACVSDRLEPKRLPPDIADVFRSPELPDAKGTI